jgi:hypothetical protein
METADDHELEGCPGPDRNIDDESFSFLGIIICAIPVIFVALHIVYPDISFLKISANIVVLFFLSFMISFLEQWIESGMMKNMEYHIHFLGPIVLTLTGGILSVFFGWHSTIVLLVLYLAAALILAVLNR